MTSKQNPIIQTRRLFVLTVFLCFGLVCSIQAQVSKAKPVYDCFLSTGDAYFLGLWMSIDSEESIKDSFKMLKDVYNVRRIYWRGLQGVAQLNKTEAHEESPRFASYYRYSKKMYDEVKVNEIAVKVAHDLGMEIYGVANLCDLIGRLGDAAGNRFYPGGFYTKEGIIQEKWLPVDKYNFTRQSGTIDFSYSEARKFFIDAHKDLIVDTGYDGVMLINYAEDYTMRYDNQFGYNEPIIKEFIKRYKLDPRKEKFNRFASKQDWEKLKGEYITKLLKEFKTSLKKHDVKLGIMINPFEPNRSLAWNAPQYMKTGFGNTYFDLTKWVKEDIIDEFIVYGYAGRNVQIKVINDLKWLTREKNIGIGYRTSGPSDPIWDGVKKAGIASVITLHGEKGYLDHSDLPMQPISSLKSKNEVDVMKILSQIILGKTKVKVKDLVHLTKHKNIVVRRMTYFALAKLKDQSAAPIIEQGLKDPENGVRNAAMGALKYVNSSQSAQKIIDLLERQPTQQIMEIAKIVFTARTLNPNPKDFLINVVKTSKSFEARYVSLWSLQLLIGNDESVIPVCENVLKNDKIALRIWAVDCLGRIKRSSKAVQILLDVVAGKDESTASRAAYWLGKIYKKKDRETDSYKEKILTGLKQLFVKYGSKCARKDATWGYSQTGNALLDCGSKGEQILEDLKDTASDPIIRDNAFKVLYLRTHPGYFLKVTEEKDDELFRNRPIHKDQAILSISFENKSFLKPSRGYVGKLYQIEGKSGIFKKTGPFIEKNKEYTGSTSLKIAPKNKFFGWTAKGVGIDQDFSFSFDLYRTKNGAFNLFLYERIILGSRAFKEACAGIHIKANGTLFLRNIKNNRWTSTELIIPHESKIKLIVDGDKARGIFRVSIKKENGEIIQSSINAYFPKGSLLNMYELFSISKEGGNVYVDNIKLIQKKDKLKAKPVFKKKDESSPKNIIQKIDNPEIIRCSFEEKNNFYKNITGITGTQKSLFGRWGNFSKNGPLIVDNQKHNGKQCVKLIRGGKQLVASAQKTSKINDNYVLTLWIKRMDSAFLVYVCNKDNKQSAGIFVAADGSVRLRNFKRRPDWKLTKLKVPSGKWVKLQIISAMKENRYRVAVFKNGKREISTVSSEMNIKGQINTIVINAQVAMGSVTYVDDISLLNVFDSD
jgi:HEAT repeats